MIRLSANLSKKLPIPGKDFSSQQYGASLEIEVSDADKPEAIQTRIRELYTLLSTSIDAQIAGASAQLPDDLPTNPLPRQPVQHQQLPPPPPVQQRNGYATGGRNRVAASNSNGSTNGNGRRVTCTEAQAKCIYAICKSQNIDMAAVLADFNVADPRDLHVRDASRLIDQLKGQQNGAAH